MYPSIQSIFLSKARQKNKINPQTYFHISSFCVASNIPMLYRFNVEKHAEEKAFSARG